MGYIPARTTCGMRLHIASHILRHAIRHALRNGGVANVQTGVRGDPPSAQDYHGPAVAAMRARSVT